LEKKSGYNYYNKTLIKLLEITEEEQKQLKTIISKEEKARRRAEKKQWSHEKRDNERKPLKESINIQIKNMIEDKKTYCEIAEELNISEKKIANIAEKYQKEKLVIEMLENKQTYEEITKKLKIARRDISKIKKQNIM
jgi:uncharacterized protein YerC